MKSPLFISTAAVLAFADTMAQDSQDAQDFLEFEPYWDYSAIPLNDYKKNNPFVANVVSRRILKGSETVEEVDHITIDHKGDFPYIEGQGWGVIPPGTREKDGKPHAVRLYSIASSRYGDDKTGKTGSLCVRCATDETYWDFLCDTEPGAEIAMTGPAGKVMLMPEEDPTTDYIMVATGTGVAPFRGFVRRLFFEDTPAANAYSGEAWLLQGTIGEDPEPLYQDEFQDAEERFPGNFRLDYVIGEIQLQEKFEENIAEIFEKLGKNAHIFFSGSIEMTFSILDILRSFCEANGIDYDRWIKDLKKKQQLHVNEYPLKNKE